jgi:HD-GYP domain-containing protein (c-di-GMP phosphodiesterase class II)
VIEETADEPVRVAEVVGALCLATDLAMGFPFEHGLRSTLLAMRLAERLGVDQTTATETYYVCLLSYAGCTADAEVTAELFAGDMTRHFAPVMFGSQRQIVTGLARSLPDPTRSAPVRAAQTLRRLPRASATGKPHLTALCEVAEMLAARLAMPASIRAHFAFLTERWDGRGRLGRAARDEIPLSVRITHVARDATFQRVLGTAEDAARVVRRRAGHAFDPAIARILADDAKTLLADRPQTSEWPALIACEPSPRSTLTGDGLDAALRAMGDFADLVSPNFVGHAAGVASLVATAATRMGFAERDVTTIRRAALVHDVGRVAVATRVWQKPDPLDADDWEKVRLHAYHTERVLAKSAYLARLASVAGAHHERLDGSGYHRGATARDLGLDARLLAAADAYHAMTEPRPHRDALLPEVASETLLRECRAGLFDPDAVAAVLDAAGLPVRRIDRPAGLTDRETEVVALIARGLQTKQVARILDISPKTADHHIQNAYAKIGVSTRAAAALFAMEQGLVAPGELPMVTPARPS